jgi:hypothetical protein
VGVAAVKEVGQRVRGRCWSGVGTLLTIGGARYERDRGSNWAHANMPWHSRSSLLACKTRWSKERQDDIMMERSGWWLDGYKLVFT